MSSDRPQSPLTCQRVMEAEAGREGLSEVTVEGARGPHSASRPGLRSGESHRTHVAKQAQGYRALDSGTSSLAAAAWSLSLSSPGASVLPSVGGLACGTQGDKALD